jgi:hypothetical protein
MMNIIRFILCTGLLFTAGQVIAPVRAQAETVSNTAAVGQATPSPDDSGGTNFLTARRWSPYLVGVGIGILSWLSFLLSDSAIGVSTAYVRSCGMLESMIRPQQTKQKEYYQKFTPKIDWEWMLVAGLLLGAFISAVTSGDFSLEWVPPKWATEIGTERLPRWLTAFAGGMILAIGSRWAGGCTSGHGISGTLQLVVSSWIAVVCFFISGVLTAMLIYNVLF